MVSFESEEYNPFVRYVPWTYIMGRETIGGTCQLFANIQNKWDGKIDILDLTFEDDYVCFKLGTNKIFYKDLVDSLNWPPHVKLNFYRILKKTYSFSN